MSDEKTIASPDTDAAQADDAQLEQVSGGTCIPTWDPETGQVKLPTPIILTTIAIN